MPNNLLITGKIRSGKSTLLKEMIDPFLKVTGGYYVQRLFIQGESRAFRLVDLNRECYLPNLEVQNIESFSDLIAVIGEEKHLYFDPFRKIGVPALKQAAEKKQLILMDELGRFETKVPEFMQAVFKILDNNLPVLGVIKKETNPFLERIRERSDVYVIDMDEIGLDTARREVERFLNSKNYSPSPALKL
ncbi:MAG: nucleoside-triphosphatase [Desulfitobacteriia bacterium]|jgi:nucleoside-triphosphatase